MNSDGLADYRAWVCWLCLLVGLSCTSSHPQKCSQEARLAFVHDVPIAWADLGVLQARVGVHLERPSDGMALLDLLWQESARQELGLAGGLDTQKSRERVVRIYERHAGNSSGAVPFDPTRLPEGAALTECGLAILQRDKPEVAKKVSLRSVLTHL